MDVVNSTLATVVSLMNKTILNTKEEETYNDTANLTLPANTTGSSDDYYYYYYYYFDWEAIDYLVDMFQNVELGLAIIGLFGNSLFVYVTLCHYFKGMRFKSNIHPNLINLCFVDSFFLLTKYVIPLIVELAGAHTYTFFVVRFLMYSFSDFFCRINSCLTILVICVERYLAITKMKTRRSEQNKKYGICRCSWPLVVVWVVTTLIVSPAFIWYVGAFGFENEAFLKNLDGLGTTETVRTWCEVTVMFSSITLCAYLYGRTFYFLRHHNKQNLAIQKKSTANTSNALRLVIIVTVVFYLCVMPKVLFSLVFYGEIPGSLKFHQSRALIKYGLIRGVELCLVINASTNSFIYTLSSGEYKKAYKTHLLPCWRKEKSEQETTITVSSKVQTYT